MVPVTMIVHKMGLVVRFNFHADLEYVVLISFDQKKLQSIRILIGVRFPPVGFIHFNFQIVFLPHIFPSRESFCIHEHAIETM